MEKSNPNRGATAPGVDQETAVEIRLLRNKMEEIRGRLNSGNLPPAERDVLRVRLSEMEKTINRVYL